MATRSAGEKVTKPTAKAPTRAKAATPRSTAAATKRAPKRPAPDVVVTIAPDERQRMIAEAAYYRAERRGFSGGSEIEDWLAAEAEVDGLLHSTRATEH